MYSFGIYRLFFGELSAGIATLYAKADGYVGSFATRVAIPADSKFQENRMGAADESVGTADFG